MFEVVVRHDAEQVGGDTAQPPVAAQPPVGGAPGVAVGPEEFVDPADDGQRFGRARLELEAGIADSVLRVAEPDEAGGRVRAVVQRGVFGLGQRRCGEEP
ncbi:hypothetical protein O1M54_10825 [Streptomyces diastatochromogenes]|nr:hypothetical protein [Streptomyces diastatochromogenes]